MAKSDRKPTTGRESRDVLVITWTELQHGREIYRGIWEYATYHAAQAWRLTRIPLEKLPSRMPNAPAVDGVLAGLVSDKLCAQARRLAPFLVDFAEYDHDAPDAVVREDNHEVGRMAARHMLRAGVRNCAFYCGAVRPAARRRAAGWFEVMGQRQDLRLFCDPRTLEALPRDLAKHVSVFDFDHWPSGFTAVLAHTPWDGQIVVEKAHAAGLAVPSQVAVLSGDNDAFVCETTLPALSSVDVNSRRLGFEAARVLDRFFQGKAPGQRTTLVPPARVIPRRSSDVAGVEDEVVAAAIRFMRARLGDAINIEDVLDHVLVGRRTLERRFREALGYSPHQALNQERIALAQELLATTDLTIDQIARSVGFRYAAHFSTVFGQVVGRPPNRFRETVRPEERRSS